MLPCIDQIEDDSEQVDTIVTLIHKQYNSCNFKPSNAYQYTILAALVLVDEACNKFRVVSLATGSKCLPTSRFSALGDALHDSHAEVLAKRGALRWFHEEIQRCVMRGHCSEWIERCDELHKWRLKKEVSLFMYISTLPCGDASMRYLASTQDPEIALLKDSSSFPILSPDVTARGRDNYSLFGVLRTKPGRADSPSTLCMSCSDKIAAWNVVGIQGAFGAKLFAPIYISFLIVGEINVNERRQMRTECERALFCRLASVQGLPDGYRVAQTKVLFTSRPFLYSRTSLQSLYSTEKIVSSSNESLCFVADSGFHHEVIINGVKRGVQAKLRGLKKHRPQLCKASLFDLHRETLLSMDSLDYPPTMSYYDAKRSASCEYQLAKSVLRGAGAPFAGWCVSGERWESFDGSGNSISSRETSETLFSRRMNV